MSRETQFNDALLQFMDKCLTCLAMMALFSGGASESIKQSYRGLTCKT